MNYFLQNGFGMWRGKRAYPIFHVGFTEDDLVTNLTSVIRASEGDNTLICDTKIDFMD